LVKTIAYFEKLLSEGDLKKHLIKEM
jgi:hypothetical protein